jgi:hypothetical protein
MTDKLSFCVHFLAYYLCWVACVYAAALDHPYHGPVITLIIILLQIVWQTCKQLPWVGALVYGIGLALLGGVTDTFWLDHHFFKFNANPFDPYFSPLWMMSLWLSLGFNLVVLYRRLLRYYLIWGLITGPAIIFAYWVGVKVGAASLVNNDYWFFILLGVSWAILLPLSLFVYNYCNKVD